MLQIPNVKKHWLAIVMVATFAAPAAGQDISFELIDSGVLTHSVHGQGIEMRIKPSAMPPGGLRGDIMQEMMLPICKHYAPSIIPFVIANGNISEPDFIAVRVVSGNANSGAYVLQAFTIEDGTCGGEL